MGNLSKNLKLLFYKYIEEKNKPKTYSPPAPLTRGVSPMYCGSKTNGLIHFYEWSNMNNIPKLFYTLDAFDIFLEKSNLKLLGWQREIIKHCNVSYVCCKKGSKDLEVRPTYDALRKVIDEGDVSLAPSISQPISRPKMVFDGNGEFEPEGRWGENGLGKHYGNYWY